MSPSTTPEKGETSGATTNSNNLPSAIEFEPPLACVRRILKNTLPASTHVGKDASAAFARACGIFIIYISACANDFARENRRQTITANDVLAAVKELDFEEFSPQLMDFLDVYRASEKSKKDAKAKAAAAKASAAQEEADHDDHDIGEDGHHDNNNTKPRTTGGASATKEQHVGEATSSVDGTKHDDDESTEDEHDDTHRHHTDDEDASRASGDSSDRKRKREMMDGDEDDHDHDDD